MDLYLILLLFFRPLSFKYIFNYYPQKIFVVKGYSRNSILYYPQELSCLINIFKLTFLFRFLKASKLVEKLVQFIPISDRVIYTLSLIKLTLMLLFVGHLMGCLWHVIGKIGIYENYENNWIDEY